MNNYKLRTKILSDERLDASTRLYLAALFEGVNWDTRQHVLWGKAHRANFCQTLAKRFNLDAQNMNAVIDLAIKTGWATLTKQDNDSWLLELNANV